VWWKSGVFGGHVSWNIRQKKKLTTKDTMTTKMEFDELSDRVVEHTDAALYPDL